MSAICADFTIICGPLVFVGSAGAPVSEQISCGFFFSGQNHPDARSERSHFPILSSRPNAGGAARSPSARRPPRLPHVASSFKRKPVLPTEVTMTKYHAPAHARCDDGCGDRRI